MTGLILIIVTILMIGAMIASIDFWAALYTMMIMVSGYGLYWVSTTCVCQTLLFGSCQ